MVERSSTSPSAPLRAASREAVSAVVRQEWGRVLAALLSHLGHLELAEDALQDAFVAALVSWPEQGVPDSPRAWLLRTARHKAIDVLRRDRVFQEKQQQLAVLANLEAAPEPADLDEFPDERLRLIFTCCHPALGHEVSVALTLKTVCGLNTPQIARAFVLSESTLAQRIVRAKRKIAHAGIPYQVPDPDAWPDRMQAVLAVIYFIFNEGYAALEGPTHARVDLCEEAIRLGRIVQQLAPQEVEAVGLLALMLLHHSRRYARATSDGGIIPLEFQDRSGWDHDDITEGLGLLSGVVQQPERMGSYCLQAALSAEHAKAASFADTDWAAIVALYDRMYALAPNPVLVVNRAVALSYARDPQAGLAALDILMAEPRLAKYQPFHAARADLLARHGDTDAARRAYGRAIALSRNAAERAFLQQRLARLPGDPSPGVAAGSAGSAPL